MPDSAAEEAWRALAPAIAGRPRVRVSRDGGRTYRGSWERALDARLPDAPAAVLLYDAAGAARCLAGDFDVSRGGAAQVDTDAAAFAALVEACGGRSFADQSPTGGRHVYVIWARPIPINELRPVLHALRALYPSLDITPMTNPTAGCIRPPGARHKTGGHQALTTPLQAAMAAVAAPCGPEVWAGLLGRLAPQLAALTGHPDARGERAAGGEFIPRPGGPARLSARIERIAVDGVYEAERYASPSEARQAVITAAVGAGWQLPEVAARLERGTWPALAALYARYRPTARRSALGRDWRKAIAFVESRKTGRRSTTSPPHTAPGATAHRRTPADPDSERRWIGVWWNGALAVERLRYTGPGGISRRLLLRSIGAMAARRGTRYLDVGRRSLSLGCWLDDSTVSELLREIRSEPDPWLVLIEAQRGVHGDLYELRIPAAVAEVAAWRRWQGGGWIEAVHPVFGELGGARALVYEALTRDPAPRRDLAHDACLPARTVAEALTALAEHGLAENVPNEGWRRGGVSLDALAVELGVTERVEALVAEYAIERAEWRALLGIGGAGAARDVVYAGPGAAIWWPTEPTDDPAAEPTDLEDTAAGADPDAAAVLAELEAALALLARELGAVVLDEELADPRYGVYAATRAAPAYRDTS